jgi:hypothetical protein
VKIQTSEETERVEVRARGAVAWVRAGSRASVRLMKACPAGPHLHTFAPPISTYNRLRAPLTELLPMDYSPLLTMQAHGCI